MTSAYAPMRTLSQLPLDALIRDEALQVRQKGLVPRTVEQYRVAVRHAQSGSAPLPPITVGRVGGLLYVVDGFHRTKAHELEGVSEIAAEVVELPTLAQAKWMAAEGNLTHGLPLQRQDRREAFKRFIRAGMHKHADIRVSRQMKSGRPAPDTMSLKEIAARVGISKSCARLWLIHDFPRVYRALYKCTDEPRNDGADLVPYEPYREESPAALARQSLINLGAAIAQCSEGAIPEVVHGLAAIIDAIKERFGHEKLSAAYDAGWQDGWHHKPAPVDDF